MLLYKPSLLTLPQPRTSNSTRRNPNKRSVSIITNSTTPTQRRRTMSAFEARISLVLALASQASSLSQRLLADTATEVVKYVFPKRFESRNLEEALMAVPDLETVNFKVLSRNDQYEIREVEPYFVAETTMPGKTGFDFNGASQSFNVLAEYLFGKNTTKEKMEMTTPVFTRKTQSDGEKMEMTTPVITKRLEDQDKWQMSFVMPSKYGANLPLPKDSSVKIKEVQRKISAVLAFSDDGPTVLISKDKEGYVYGGYASQTWERHGGFYGDMKSFLFQLYPKASIFRPTGANNNIQWCAVNFSSEDIPNGIGFGGRVNHLGLFLSASFDQGHTFNCTTFGSPSLSKTSRIFPEVIECWRVVPKGKQGTHDAVKGTVLDRFKEDRHVLNMVGLANSSE